MNVDQNAPMVAYDDIWIKADLDTVWSTLTDINNWSEWQSGVSAARLLGPLSLGVNFEWKASGLGIKSTIRDFEPSNRIGWTGKALGMSAIHLWMLEPEAEGTHVWSEESMSGWFIRLIKIFDAGFLEKSMEASLQELKARVENN